MEKYINYNGKILGKENLLFGIDNRAFQYGDSLFETIRVFDGKIPFLSHHIERLTSGMFYFGYEFSDDFNEDLIENEIYKLLITNKLKDARVRLEVFRNSGGLYTPTQNGFQFIISAQALDSSVFNLESEGLELYISEDVRLGTSNYQRFKTGSTKDYIVAGLEKKRNNWDESILLNCHNRIAEASSGNIFLIKNDVIYTPALSEGCIDGVMRKIIISTAKEMGIKVFITEINIDFLESVVEIWVSNAIQGMKWVKQFNDITYSKSMFYKILEHIMIIS
jgi:branched-subunit amino acid aminotransferase/4-amino-4-deoxychorismate lyase